MNKLSFLFLILLALPLISAASDNVLHEDWHSYHDFFTIDNDYYELIAEQYVTGNDVTIKALVKENDHSYIITAQTTKDDDVFNFSGEEFCTSSDFRRYCITDLSIDPADGARADENGQYHYGIELKIYEDQAEKADLTLTKELQTTTLFYGEENKVSLDLYNEGNLRAENITLNETIGGGLQITRTDQGFINKNGQLTVNVPYLGVDQHFSIRYWVKPTAYVNTTTITTSYRYDNPYPTTSSKENKLTIVWPYKATCTLSAKETSILQPATLRLTIGNAEERPIDVTITASHDQGLQAQTKDKLKTTTTATHAQTDTLDAGEAATYSLDLSAPFTGDYDAKIAAQIKVNDQTFQVTCNKTLTIKTDTLNPTIALSKTVTRSGEPLTIGFYLQNKDQDVNFYDINGYVASDFFNETISKDSVAAGKQVNLIFKTYYPPKTNDTQAHTITFAGTFTTRSGEQYDFRTQKTFTVYAKDRSIFLTQTVDKTQATRGDNLTITVQAENIADSGILHVEAADTYTPASLLDKIFGNRKAGASIAGGETKELYVYKLAIPQDFYEDHIIITTSLTIDGKAFANKTTTINVTNPAPRPPDAPTMTQNDAVTTKNETNNASSSTQDDDWNTTPTTDKKKGFAGLIQGIADFFSSIFS